MNTRLATVFAGPSAFGLPPALRADPTIVWRPPAQRGDVDRLVDGGPPGVLVLCDGIFQSVPAVSHAELCRALDARWQVWGVASLGAIRAWELRAEGMRGHGRVFAMFERLPDLCDDELCLLHFPEPPYFPLTEALVNVRHALTQHGAACGIGAAAAQSLVDALSALWFGDRSEACMRTLLVDRLGVAPAGADAWLVLLRTQRAKSLDLADLLHARPWAGTRGAPTAKG